MPRQEGFERLTPSKDVWSGARRWVGVTVQKKPHDLVLWTAPGGVRSFDVPARGEAPEALIAGLAKAMEEPASPFTPERPFAVYIEKPSPWEREQIAEMGIVLVETPPDRELDRAFTSFEQRLGGRRFRYLVPGVSAEAVRVFFEVARDFYLGRPWDRTEDNSPYRVRGLSSSPLWVSVLGSGGQQFGLGVYSKAAGALAMLSGDPRSSMAHGLMSLTFDPPDDVGVDLCEELQKHGWVVEPGRIPLLLVVSGEDKRVGNATDMELMIDLMGAMSGFLKDGGTRQPVPSGRTAQVDGPMSDDFLHEVAHGQRNDPCPCGSGSKLKKCCG